MNAVRVYVRELMRPSVKRSSQRVAISVDIDGYSSEIFGPFSIVGYAALLFLHISCLTVSHWPLKAHLAQPLRKVLPSSPNDIIFSKNAPDLRLSPALRAAL